MSLWDWINEIPPDPNAKRSRFWKYIAPADVASAEAVQAAQHVPCCRFFNEDLVFCAIAQKAGRLEISRALRVGWFEFRRFNPFNGREDAGGFVFRAPDGTNENEFVTGLRKDNPFASACRNDISRRE